MPIRLFTTHPVESLFIAITLVELAVLLSSRFPAIKHRVQAVVLFSMQPKLVVP